MKTEVDRKDWKKMRKMTPGEIIDTCQESGAA